MFNKNFYNNIIPKASFIGRYMEYMRSQETSVDYDFWSAVWLLGSVVGRNVIVDRPRAPVHLNWYVILVAESGTTRKSSSVKSATNLLKQVVARDEILSSKTTPQKLEAHMHALSVIKGKANVYFSISELVMLLGRDTGSMQMPGMLVDLYDCPIDRIGAGTLERGETKIIKPFCTLLGASTPSWLQRAINPDVIEGGFTSRTLFILSDKPKKRIAWPEENQNATLEQKIISDLTILKTQSSLMEHIEISPEGLARFTRWYKNRPLHDDAYRGSFESREDAHILRLAACLAINESGWIIRKVHIEAAIKVINKIKDTSATLFVCGEVGDKTAYGITKVRQLLIESGVDGVARKKLLLKALPHLNAKELTAVLDIMHELDMVQKFVITNGEKGRNPEYWRATNLILEPGTMKAIINNLN